MIEVFVDEYWRYRQLGERALTQMPDAALNATSAPDGNSAAVLVRHMSGNLLPRFTDFLTSDGEKPWRDREQEFTEGPYMRAEVDAMRADGSRVLEATLSSRTDGSPTRYASRSPRRRPCCCCIGRRITTPSSCRFSSTAYVVPEERPVGGGISFAPLSQLRVDSESI